MAQDEISKKVELNWLSAFYGGLLTDKQRQVLTLHCEEDLSLTEIAQEVGISRQGVHELLTARRGRCSRWRKSSMLPPGFSVWRTGWRNAGR